MAEPTSLKTCATIWDGGTIIALALGPVFLKSSFLQDLIKGRAWARPHVYSP